MSLWRFHSYLYRTASVAEGQIGLMGRGPPAAHVGVSYGGCELGLAANSGLFYGYCLCINLEVVLDSLASKQLEDPMQEYIRVRAKH